MRWYRSKLPISSIAARVSEQRGFLSAAENFQLDPDWVDKMRTVIGGADANADNDYVYMMFSATFPKGACAVAKEYMSKHHVRIRVGRAGSSHMNVIRIFPRGFGRFQKGGRIAAEEWQYCW